MKHDIENWFTYHPPSAEDQIKYNAINSAAKHLAEVISDCCPMCADTMDAIRKVREARMTANAAIACGPRVKECTGYAPADQEMIAKKEHYAAIERDRNHNF